MYRNLLFLSFCFVVPKIYPFLIVWFLISQVCSIVLMLGSYTWTFFSFSLMRFPNFIHMHEHGWDFTNGQNFQSLKRFSSFSIDLFMLYFFLWLLVYPFVGLDG